MEWMKFLGYNNNLDDRDTETLKKEFVDNLFVHDMNKEIKRLEKLYAGEDVV